MATSFKCSVKKNRGRGTALIILRRTASGFWYWSIVVHGTNGYTISSEHGDKGACDAILRAETIAKRNGFTDAKVYHVRIEEGNK